jgi:hypothetical protein
LDPDGHQSQQKRTCTRVHGGTSATIDEVSELRFEGRNLSALGEHPAGQNSIDGRPLFMTYARPSRGYEH